MKNFFKTSMANRNLKTLFLSVTLMSCLTGCNLGKKVESVSIKKIDFDINKEIKKCELQLEKTVAKLTDVTMHPRLIETNASEWTLVKSSKYTWTSGFYAGILWYMYDVTGDEKWKTEAIKRTEVFKENENIVEHHDIGFMMFPTYGNGFLIGDKEHYKDVLLTSAQSLSTRYNPNVGTIKSWNVNKNRPRWTQHITIIDNMLNLELLFWAAKNGGQSKFYDIANKHAETTMKNHFRKDFTSWHVIEYDTITGNAINKHTRQGYSDESCWSRGQAWGIYGYIMTFRETKDKRYLELAKDITDKYLSMLPEDMVPYWDFNAPNIPNEERDASAAAIVASALLELSTLVDNETEETKYYNTAINILNSLSSKEYSGINKTDSFLIHSTGAKSLGKEIDVALMLL